MITDNETNNARSRPPQNTISLWLPHELHEQLNDFCVDHCVNRSAFVRAAIVARLGTRTVPAAPKPLVDLDWE